MERNPSQEDISAISQACTVYLRFLNTKGKYRIKDCQIGVVDISDHSAGYLNVNLNEREKHFRDIK